VSSSICTSITIPATCNARHHALYRGGSYFLTYHRFASPAQVERAHPGIRGFLAAKPLLDPSGVFQSDWYQHLREAFA
jgi:hypothetical protein